MTTILQMIDDGDLCSAALLALVLLGIGGKMVDGRPILRMWGVRLGTLAGLLYFARSMFVDSPSEPEAFIWLVLRSLAAFALALPVIWISLSLAYFLWRYAIQPPLAKFRHRRLEAANDSRQQHESEEQQRRRALQDAESRSREREEAKTEAELQRRRDDARLRCTTLYDQHSSSLSQHFPRERLREYFEQYMSDHVPAEIVEARARTLTRLIEDCVRLHAPDPKRQFQSLAEIADFYEKQREEAASLPYDHEIKDSMITNINVQEETATRKFLAR